jgi:hypothetical protein
MAAGGHASTEPGATVEVPADAPWPAPGLADWKPVLPGATPDGGRVAEQALASLVRDYCLPALEQPASEAAFAMRLGAQATANPWAGDPASYLAPDQAWTVAGRSRVWFWIEADETGTSSSCWVKAFDGRRSVMAPAALSAVEAYAAANVFGATRYPGAPLSRLGTAGSVERIYTPRDFSASLSWDRSDYPANEGFVVIISAQPLPQAIGS